VRRLRTTLPILILLWCSAGSAGPVAAQERRPFLDVFLALADVRPGMTVAEIGAGNGAFSARLAGTVGPTGRIFANEISKEKLAALDRLKEEPALDNLTVVRGATADPKLPGPVDRITMIDVYHHLEEPADFLAALRSSLKPGGRLLVAAVLNRRNPQAKPSTSKTHDPCVSDPDDTRKTIEAAGFVFETLVLHDDPARAFYWPTSYALVFRVAEGAAPSHVASDDARDRPVTGSVRIGPCRP
jgi:predicted methyltransferase